MEPTFIQRHIKEYRCWVRMIHRCHNEDYDGYEDYGKRGITVCERWREEGTGFANFMADLGPATSPAHSLDRRDNNGHYEKDNCRWATVEQQANNRRTSKFLTHRGHRFTMAQWAELIGVSRKTLWKRLSLDWPIGDVLTPWPASLSGTPAVAETN